MSAPRKRASRFGLFDVIFAVFLLETLDSACGIDEFLLARIERMAHRANFRVNFLGGTSGLEGIAAPAANLYSMVLGMYAFLHGSLL